MAKGRKRKALAAVIAIAATSVGLFLLYRVFRRTNFDDIQQALMSAPIAAIAAAAVCTAGSFASIAAMEWLAVRYAGRPISVSRVVKTAIAAIGIGHSIGLVSLSSAAIRYRMYSRAGFDAMTVAKVVVFSGVTVGLGLAAVGGLALLWRGEVLASLLHVGAGTVRLLGILALTGVAAYVALCAVSHGRWELWRLHQRMPSGLMACAQVVFGSLDLLFVSAALYSALRGFAKVDYPTSAALYVGSDASAIVGHVPGGWGIFEYIVTRALDGSMVLAGVLLFRAAYFLLPLTVGLAILLADEVGRRRAARHKRAPAHAYGR